MVDDGAIDRSKARFGNFIRKPGTDDAFQVARNAGKTSRDCVSHVPSLLRTISPADSIECFPLGAA